MTITERRIGDVTLLELKGRLVFGDGATLLRSRLNDLLDEARLKFLLDLRRSPTSTASGSASWPPSTSACAGRAGT